MSKKILLFFALLGLLLIGGYFFVRLRLQKDINKEEERLGMELSEPDTLGGKKVSEADLRPLFIKRLQLLLKASSNNLYDLSVEDLRLDMLASKLSLHGVKLEPDAKVLDSLKKLDQTPENVFSASFDSLLLEDVNLDDVVTSKTLDFKNIKLSHPVITIRRKKAPQKKKDIEEEDFSQRFLKEMEKLSINSLQIEDGTITVYNDTKKSPPLKLQKVAVNMKDILLDSTTRQDQQRFLFAREATLSFEDYSRPTPDGLYIMKLRKATVMAHQRNVRLQGFSFTSPFDRQTFSRKQTKSKELYNVSLPNINLKGVDWWALLNEEEIVAGEFEADGGDLNIYLDRSLPPRNKMGNFPSQLLVKLPVKLDIAKASLTNLDFTYAEYSPISTQTGTVYMDDVALRISNLSNQTTGKPVVADGSALFMRKVPLKAQFAFDMKRATAGAFTATINAAAFDGTLINAFAVPMGLMKIERGRLLGAQATLKGDQWKCGGNVFIPYEDLKLSLMEKEDGKKKLDKKDVMSFAANLFVIKNNNPKEGPKSRREQAEFTRIPEGGFFMLVWKTLLVGALKTMGAPTKIASKTVSSQTGKQ